MANTSISFTFRMLGTDEMLAKRNLPRNHTSYGTGAKAQQILDSEVMRYMSPYMPFDTGTMINSMILATNIGSGEVVVNTPYAKRRLKKARHNGLRGPDYFERMKVDHLDDLKRTVEKVTGGSFK